MLAAVGKAQGDICTPTSEQERTNSDDTMDILDSWAQRSKDFSARVRALFAITSKDMAEQIDKCMADALTRVSKVEFSNAEVSHIWGDWLLFDLL